VFNINIKNNFIKIANILYMENEIQKIQNDINQNQLRDTPKNSYVTTKKIWSLKLINLFFINITNDINETKNYK